MFLAITCCIFITACNNKPLEFDKLEQFSKTDTTFENGKTLYYKEDIYIVKNYGDNLENERAVDSLAYRNRAKDLANYTSYTIVVYKHSDATDIDNLKANPKDFERESFLNDMIYIYRWSNGTWSSKMKFKGRDTVEAQEMIRED